MATRWKGPAVVVFTLCLGSLLLFAQSGTATALGVGLIVLASTAVVTAATKRSAKGAGPGSKRGSRRD